MKELFIFNSINKRIAHKLLATNFIVNNPIYRHFHDKRMKEIMARCEVKPDRVYLEITNACHNQCKFCPHSIMKRPVGNMNTNLFKDLANQIKEWGVNEVVLGQFGEPLMDIRFFDMVRYLKKIGINKIQSNVSSQAITKRVANYLISEPLHELFISCSPAGERNVRYFLSKRIKTKPNPSPQHKIYLSFIEGETTPVYKWARKFVDGISVSYPHNWAGWRGIRNSFKNPCRLPWVSMYVACNGKVHLCCMDYEVNYVTGDSTMQSLKNIWVVNNSIYRNIHKQSLWNTIPICKDCNYNNHNKSPWWV